ncbi:MAG: hypothetical protein V4819_09265 [Verrucomicrobiota bacterium]
MNGVAAGPVFSRGHSDTLVGMSGSLAKWYATVSAAWQIAMSIAASGIPIHFPFMPGF